MAFPSSPKISICIPVYNPGPFLKTALQSVLDQDEANFELIVVDDCSSQPVNDTTGEFGDQRLRFERNQRTLGIPGNWNRCLELARGEYITIFHQDDLMCPGNLSRKAAVLDAYPEVGFVYSNIQRIDDQGQVIGGHYIPQPEADTVFPGWKIFEMTSQTGNPISCPSVMARMDCYKQMGIFDARLRFAPDQEMWMRFASRYAVGYLAEPFISYRVHRGQETQRFASSGRDYQDVLLAFDLSFRRRLPPVCHQFEQKTYRTLCHQSVRMAYWKLKQGEIRHSINYMRVACQSFWRAGNPFMRP